QEVGHAQIDPSSFDEANRLGTERWNAPLPEIDGKRREPGSRQGQREAGVLILGGGVRERDDSLALGKPRGKLVRVFSGAMSRQQSDAMTPCQLRDDVKGPESPSRVQGPEPPDLDPEDPHLAQVTRRMA